jgi:hypothetical protein
MRAELVVSAVTHRALAVAWANWNGQTGTDKQTDRIMRQLSSADLVRMLAERGIVLVERSR